MKRVLSLCVVGILGFSTTARSEGKLAKCERLAGTLEDQARKEFLRGCYSGKVDLSKEQLAKCTADAKAEPEAEREAFMRQCLAK